MTHHRIFNTCISSGRQDNEKTLSEPRYAGAGEIIAMGASITEAVIHEQLSAMASARFEVAVLGKKQQEWFCAATRVLSRSGSASNGCGERTLVAPTSSCGQSGHVCGGNPASRSRRHLRHDPDHRVLEIVLVDRTAGGRRHGIRAGLPADAWQPSAVSGAHPVTDHRSSASRPVDADTAGLTFTSAPLRTHPR